MNEVMHISLSIGYASIHIITGLMRNRRNILQNIYINYDKYVLQFDEILK